MKKIIWSFLLMTIVTAILFIACKREVEHTNKAYLTQAAFIPEMQLTLDSQNTASIGVQLVQTQNQDVSVDLAIDTSSLAAYNLANNSSYKAVPAASCVFSSGSTVVIPAGTASVNAALTVTAWPGYDSRSRYVVPVKIANVSNGIPILQASSVVYIIINKIITANAAIGSFTLPDITRGVPPTEYTVEAKFKVVINNFRCNDPYSSRIINTFVSDRALSVFSSAAGEGNGSFRLRVGNSVDVNDITYGTPLQQGTWYHFAYSYKAGVYSLFINGQLIGTKSSTLAPIAGTSLIGCGNNFAFSEVRMWSKARSQSQIANNICGTDPSSPDLLAYWDFDKVDVDASGKATVNFTDLTKNKFVATKADATPVQFVSGKCPF